MNYTTLDNIAARLPEAPFYINDMEYPVVGSNVWECMKKYSFYSTRRHFKTFTVTDYKVKLGCVNQIHNVVLYENTQTTNYEPITHPNQKIFVLDTDTTTTELLPDVEIEKIKRVIPHIIGSYVDYKQEDDCLVFRDTDIKVGVEYTEIYVDINTGYPMICEDAEMLVTWYCALQHWSGEFMAGRLDGGRLQYAESKVNEAYLDAKATIRMSANDIDKLGNIITSFDRKMFGYSM